MFAYPTMIAMPAEEMEVATAVIVKIVPGMIRQRNCRGFGRAEAILGGGSSSLFGDACRLLMRSTYMY
jgi:hypothetical protein